MRARIPKRGYCYRPHRRISRWQFYAWGGFSNPDLFRKMRGGTWFYYQRSDAC
jgi:hypothetical protein